MLRLRHGWLVGCLCLLSPMANPPAMSRTTRPPEWAYARAASQRLREAPARWRIRAVQTEADFLEVQPDLFLATEETIVLQEDALDLAPVVFADEPPDRPAEAAHKTAKRR